MSLTCVIEWPIAIRQSDALFANVVHHSAHVSREPDVREGAGNTPVILDCQPDEWKNYKSSQLLRARWSRVAGRKVFAGLP
jgi:hypothetical protein